MYKFLFVVAALILPVMSHAHRDEFVSRCLALLRQGDVSNVEVLDGKVGRQLLHTLIVNRAIPARVFTASEAGFDVGPVEVRYAKGLKLEVLDRTGIQSSSPITLMSVSSDESRNLTIQASKSESTLDWIAITSPTLVGGDDLVIRYNTLKISFTPPLSKELFESDMNGAIRSAVVGRISVILRDSLDWRDGARHTLDLGNSSTKTQIDELF